MVSCLTSLKKWSVLYAEDQASTRAIYLDLLDELFGKTHIASNGLEAWACYQNESPDLIITDIGMPYLDGLVLTEKIREVDKNIPVIIMSSHIEPDKLLAAMPLRLIAYLPKPVSRQSLLKALEEAMKNVSPALSSEDRLYISEHIVWDRRLHSLYQNEQEIVLSKKEIDILVLLLSQRNKTFSYDEISHFVDASQPEKYLSEDAIKGIIKRLRKKTGGGIIENIYGVGYRLRH